MVDNYDIPPEKARDAAVQTDDSGSNVPTRDGARTPMQWDDSVNAGFSFGREVEPWLPVNPNYTRVNVKAEKENPNSVLNFYQSLLHLRKTYPALQVGDWQPLIDYPKEVLAYRRTWQTQQVMVLMNFSKETMSMALDVDVEPSNWKVILSNVRPTGQNSHVYQDLQPEEITLLVKE
jgi:alpha-glucosidase